MDRMIDDAIEKIENLQDILDHEHGNELIPVIETLTEFNAKITLADRGYQKAFAEGWDWALESVCNALCEHCRAGADFSLWRIEASRLDHTDYSVVHEYKDGAEADCKATDVRLAFSNYYSDK